jgi:hypothetical protein
MVIGCQLKLDEEISENEVNFGAVAQLGERRFCKPEVVGSIPISSTIIVGSDQ